MYFSPIELENYINQAADDYNAGRDIRENTISRVNAFLQDFNIFGEGLNWDDTLRTHRIVNILFEYVSEPVLRVAIAAALKEIIHERIRNRIPLLIISFDEAHVLIPREKSTVTSSVIKRLLRYGRHLGIGVIMIT
ncbi:MAG: ATP-binding protein [Candidatus Odinarchaeota archaeon]|nr:ATP-binding protein [Candidatus Odinarchaeota archaeon]